MSFVINLSDLLKYSRGKDNHSHLRNQPFFYVVTHSHSSLDFVFIYKKQNVIYYF